MRALGFLTIVLHVINDFQSISVTKSAQQFESVNIQCDLKEHRMPSVAVCERNYANRNSRLKVGVSVVV